MFSNFLEQTSIPLMEKLAAFTERRQEILSENIANIDTPEYRKRDLPVQDFQAALNHAVKLRQSPPPSPEITANNYQLGLHRGEQLIQPEQPTTLQPESISFQQLFPNELLTPKIVENDNLIFRDNNNRSIEQFVMELTKNNMQHTFAIETMHAQIQMLETALSGKV